MAGLIGGAPPTGAAATPQEEAEQLTKVLNLLIKDCASPRGSAHSLTITMTTTYTFASLWTCHSFQQTFSNILITELIMPLWSEDWRGKAFSQATGQFKQWQHDLKWGRTVKIVWQISLTMENPKDNLNVFIVILKFFLSRNTYPIFPISFSSRNTEIAAGFHFIQIHTQHCAPNWPVARQFCMAFLVLNLSIETRKSSMDYSFCILINACVAGSARVTPEAIHCLATNPREPGLAYYKRARTFCAPLRFVRRGRRAQNKRSIPLESWRLADSRNVSFFW